MSGDVGPVVSTGPFPTQLLYSSVHVLAEVTSANLIRITNPYAGSLASTKPSTILNPNTYWGTISPIKRSAALTSGP